MDKARKLELVRRSLGIRHKLKVHESMKPADTHEEISLSLLARWELEDELRAIEEILAEARQQSTAEKRKVIEKNLKGNGKAAKES
jgi:HD-like signal output (HDOD) protein